MEPKDSEGAVSHRVRTGGVKRLARAAVACDKAQSVLLDQVFFRMDAAKFRQFVKMLDAPPAPNPGLERLMAVKPPWSRKTAKV